MAKDPNITRTLTHEYRWGIQVKAYMAENEYNGRFATHWSTIPDHLNPIRLFSEQDVERLLNEAQKPKEPTT